jgi:competence protein ComEC
VIGALALLMGVLLGLFFAALPGPAWLLGAAASVLLTFGTRLRYCGIVRHLAWLLAGMVLASACTHRWLALCLPAASAETRVLVEGVIHGLPARDGAELQFDMDAIIVEGRPGDAHSRQARVMWRNAPVAPRAGERWRLLLRLAPFSDARNFVGPDTAVGHTDRLSADQWRVFNATGTTHLVAISGLHVTLFALVAFTAARFAWRRLSFARRVERQPFALLLGLGAAGGYALLSGFSVPAQRTWLMLALFASARLASRHIGAGRCWSLALMAVLCLDPLAPLAAGFWLSFVAVGVILMAASASAEPVGSVTMARVAGAVRLQGAILLALAPLTFAVFGGLSLAGLAVNLVAIPLVSFVLVPLVLAGALAVLVAPGTCHFCFNVAAHLYEWCWPALTWAADREFALWRATPPLWWFPFAMLAALVMLRRWPLPLRISAACVLLPLVFVPARIPEPGAVRISVLDVGRGTAALVYTHSRVLLFDTGDSWNTRGARLRRWVLPALDALGRDRVDLLMLPALDADRAHAAAALAFERELPALMVGGGWPGNSLPVRRCKDSEFRWDGVLFQSFSAGAGGKYCALRVSVGAQAMLLGGDIDVTAERELVARLESGALASDVVLISRQASSTASAPEWIEASAAALAIATGGIENSRSREVTLARWRASGAVVLDTRRTGGIELDLGTSGARVVAVARDSRYPFVWRRPQ